MNNEPAPIILDEESIKGLIYEIRSQRVMLDFDLAKVYGYMTRDFNRQVKNNQERFDSDFCFRLTQEEWDGIMWWKNPSQILLQSEDIFLMLSPSRASICL